MSRAHMAPVQSSPPEVQTSTPIRSPHVGPAATSTGCQEQVQNPKPKSPLATSVTEATEEDSIVYLGSWEAEPRPKTPKPLETMHYLSYLRVAESGPSKEWTDRVALQRSQKQRPDRKKHHGTPWDNDSHSDSDPSDYSSDSFDSDSSSSTSGSEKPSKRSSRHRHQDRAAKRQEREKLDDYNRRKWTKKIHLKYRTQICEHVGVEMPYVEGFKSIKVSEPEHYTGVADVEIFEEWLLKVLHWMAVNRMAGPDADQLRVQALSMLVAQKAARWFDDQVAGPHRSQETWSFEDAVIGIFNHCVQATTVHQASTKFDKVRYDPSKGIEDYKNTLDHWAGRMTNPPDKYTFKRHFTNGLPEDIVKAMIDKGAVPKYLRVKTMVRAVRRIEDDCALENYYLKNLRTSSEYKSDSRPKFN
ncbi:hypothetical protein L218DRAFT_1009126 [Marasmius fiardii PR-910]|nr:hypothetical protein L218DRAFT_1009126 [Marasmius fiardii PR-910]